MGSGGSTIGIPYLSTSFDASLILNLKLQPQTSDGSIFFCGIILFNDAILGIGSVLDLLAGSIILEDKIIWETYMFWIVHFIHIIYAYISTNSLFFFIFIILLLLIYLN